MKISGDTKVEFLIETGFAGAEHRETWSYCFDGNFTVLDYFQSRYEAIEAGMKNEDFDGQLYITKNINVDVGAVNFDDDLLYGEVLNILEEHFYNNYNDLPDYWELPFKIEDSEKLKSAYSDFIEVFKDVIKTATHPDIASAEYLEFDKHYTIRS